MMVSPETGETVSISILPSEAQNPALVIERVFAAIEAMIDKTPATKVVIASDDQYVQVAEAILREKRTRKKVEDSVKPIGLKLFHFHRAVTGKLAAFLKFYDDRIAEDDKALVSWTEEKERQAREENERREKLQRDEEIARRAGEVESLIDSGDVAAAEELEAAPIIPASASLTAASVGLPKVKGVGVKRSFQVEITEPDDLKLAYARPHILKEVDAMLTNKAATKLPAGHKAALIGFREELRVLLGKCPQIPANVLDVVESKVKVNATATDGKIQWPGVRVYEDKKTSTRTR